MAFYLLLCYNAKNPCHFLLAKEQDFSEMCRVGVLLLFNEEIRIPSH